MAVDSRLDSIRPRAVAAALSPGAARSDSSEVGTASKSVTCRPLSAVYVLCHVHHLGTGLRLSVIHNVDTVVLVRLPNNSYLDTRYLFRARYLYLSQHDKATIRFVVLSKAQNPRIVPLQTMESFNIRSMALHRQNRLLWAVWLLPKHHLALQNILLDPSLAVCIGTVASLHWLIASLITSSGRKQKLMFRIHN